MCRKIAKKHKDFLEIKHPVVSATTETASREQGGEKHQPTAIGCGKYTHLAFGFIVSVTSGANKTFPISNQLLPSFANKKKE